MVSCRRYILLDNRVKGILKDESNIIDINKEDFELNIDEKVKIWNIHSRNKKLSKEDFAKILEIKDYFPLLCKLYFTKEREQTGELLKFFTKPKETVENEIRSFRNLGKEKYCALVLLAL